MTKQLPPCGDSDRQAGADALAEAVRLRERPEVRVLLPFLTASDTGDDEYDEAPYPEQRAARVLALLEAVGDPSRD